MNRDELKDMLLKDPSGVLQFGDGVVEELWQLSSDASEEKSVRKAAKKALYVLRSMGFDVERKKTAEKISRSKAEMRITDDPLLSAPDSIGSNRLLIPVEDERGLSLMLYSFIINTQRGVLRFSSGPGSRSHLQKLRGMKDEGFFPVSAEYALFRLDQALQKTETGHISGLESLPDILRTGGSKIIDHPVLSIIQTGLTRIYSPQEEKSIFNLEEIMRLVLPEEDIEDVRARIDEAKKSRIILNNKSPEERIDRIIDNFYNTYFTEQRCLFYKTLLFDIALSCNYRGLEGHARILVNMAKDLGLQAVEQKEHPILNYLMYQAFAQG